MSISRARRDCRGVAALEFALVMPVLVILVLSLYDVSNAVITWWRLSTAAAAIAVADAFGWAVIAQGVENAAQRQWLINRGVREAQGYGIGQPMTAVDFERWMIVLKASAGTPLRRTSIFTRSLRS